MAKSTGGGGAVIINGVPIGFNTAAPSVEKEYDDASDSTSYDIATGLVHKTQLAVATQTTFEIEGKIDLAVIPGAIVTTLYSNPGAVPASFRYNTSTSYGSGMVDITNFKGTIDPMKVLTFTATMITHGVFTPA